MRRLRASLSNQGRIVLTTVAAVTLLLGAALSMGAPRMTVFNNAIQVAYPGRYGLAAFVAALGATALFVLVPRRPVRLAAAIAGGLALLFSMDRLGYRLEASHEALVSRSFGVTTRLGWNEISQVTVGLDDTKIVTAKKRITLDTGGLPADDAAIINRTIARRISEASLRAAR
jgi:hypothetical protein